MEKGTFAKETYICSLTDIKITNKKGMTLRPWNQPQGGLFFVDENNTANTQQTNAKFNNLNNFSHLRGQMFPSSRPPSVEWFTKPPPLLRPTVRTQPPPPPRLGPTVQFAPYTEYSFPRLNTRSQGPSSGKETYLKEEMGQINKKLKNILILVYLKGRTKYLLAKLKQGVHHQFLLL